MNEIKVCYYGEISPKEDEKIIFEKVEKYEDISNKSAFALLVEASSLDIIKFDKELRNRLKYDYIIIYKKYSKRTRINKFNNYIYVDKKDFDNINNLIKDLKSKTIIFNKSQVSNISKKKQKVLDEIYENIKDKTSFRGEDLEERFELNIRNVERYLHDINKLHNIIGYDYDKKEYYVCNEK